MDDSQRAFLDDLLAAPGPSGYEARAQRVWIDYVSQFADEVRTDDYGNAVAKREGGDPELAFAGHVDEIGYVVRRIEDDGFLRVGPIGGADRTVSKGQHVTIHADGAIPGVIGQTAIHLRDRDEAEEYDDIEEQFVDVGAESRAEAAELVSVGDPVTVEAPARGLRGTRIAGRAMDNRVGVWAAAEGFRRAVAADVDATVYAVSTIQEEVGLRGARMVGFDVAPDAVFAVDVTHATDTPGIETNQRGPVELGEGPVLTRGSVNHSVLVGLAQEAADAAGVDVQFEAAGVTTGTDADSFYTARGGIPSLFVGVPNRYMHTPVEVVDTDDLDAVAELLAAAADRAGGRTSFAVDV